ncbi:MAG TPA: hypothetical protein VGH49_00970 [Xanthobacteraceae bacterium]
MSRVAQDTLGSGHVFLNRSPDIPCTVRDARWYGAHENRHVSETLAHYSSDRGLWVRKLPFEQMFVPSTYDLIKI